VPSAVPTFADGLAVQRILHAIGFDVKEKELDG
jgi:hypothetical protein